MFDLGVKWIALRKHHIPRIDSCHDRTAIDVTLLRIIIHTSSLQNAGEESPDNAERHTSQKEGSMKIETDSAKEIYTADGLLAQVRVKR